MRHPRCVGWKPERSSHECQLQCSISCSLLAQPGAKRGREGPEQQCRRVFLRRELIPVTASGVVFPFFLFLALAWTAVPTWESIPRHFGGKVLVALIFIFLGPFEPHYPPDKVKNGCGVEDRCISRGRKINSNMSGMKQKLLLDFVCIVLIGSALHSCWNLMNHINAVTELLYMSQI